MVVTSKIIRNSYRDSVLLMKISNIVREKDGIENAEVIMGSDPNKHLLLATGLLTDEVKNATPHDIIICVSGQNEEIVKGALRMAEEMIMAGPLVEKTSQITKSLNSAIALLPGADLALISVPGPFVKKEAIRALKKGLNVMIFSDNVPLEHEIEIKRLAREQDLIVMGPDCGTSIINGTALGFANRLHRGSIGLVGASGTGIQEVTVIIHNLGKGISHAIGTGSNDVSEEVGGSTMIQGIRWLEADPATEIIVVVSKPPASRTMARVLEELKRCKKPVVANFLGAYKRSLQEGNIHFTVTLEETALTAVWMKDKQVEVTADWFGNSQVIWEKSRIEMAKLSKRQKYVRGLFSGGTLACEAGIILQDLVCSLSGNISLSGVKKLTDSKISEGHCLVDLGADEFTVGKPHPMIEPEMRRRRLLLEAQDTEVAVFLVDFVLGYGIHPDPVGATLPYIQEAVQIARDAGNFLLVVASVCGTDEDPQDKASQVRRLEDNGVIVLPTNAQASKVAAWLALRSEGGF